MGCKVNALQFDYFMTGLFSAMLAMSGVFDIFCSVLEVNKS